MWRLEFSSLIKDERIIINVFREGVEERNPVLASLNTVII